MNEREEISHWPSGQSSWESCIIYKHTRIYNKNLQSYISYKLYKWTLVMITSVLNYIATFSLDLNDSSEDSVLTSSGRLFQSCTPLKEKDLL